MSHVSTSHTEVGTKDSLAYVPKLNKSASKWTKADLGLLGVDYQYRCFDDIHIGVTDMPVELLQGKNVLVTERLISSHRKICSRDRGCRYECPQGS